MLSLEWPKGSLELLFHLFTTCMSKESGLERRKSCLITITLLIIILTFYHRTVDFGLLRVINVSQIVSSPLLWSCLIQVKCISRSLSSWGRGEDMYLGDSLCVRKRCAIEWKGFFFFFSFSLEVWQAQQFPTLFFAIYIFILMYLFQMYLCIFCTLGLQSSYVTSWLNKLIFIFIFIFIFLTT